VTPDALAALHARCFAVPRPFSAGEFRDVLSSQACFLVTGSAGFALGRAVLNEAELITLAVAPEDRRQGHGRGLLQKFEAEAARRGAVRVFLEVADDNTAARALYTAMGYRESGRRRGYYRTPAGTRLDAVVMEKRLAKA